MRVLEIYGREGCCLCDEAHAQLVPLASELGFELREVDIERDDELLRAHFERIPVLVLDGEELCHFHVDEELLRARLGSLESNS
jgi:glutaredoxin